MSNIKNINKKIVEHIDIIEETIINIEHIKEIHIYNYPENSMPNKPIYKKKKTKTIKYLKK